MEAKIQKQIIDYFSYFEEFHNCAKTCLKDCQNCALVINKLIGRCKKILNAEVDGTPLEKFPELQSKLSSILHNLISKEIIEIKNKLSTVEECFYKLCEKNKLLFDSCNNINFHETSPLVKGCVYQPPLRQLLEFAEDTLTFGGEVCGLLGTPLEVLSLKRLSTESLPDNFQISKHWHRRIAEILAYTSFCSLNVI